MILPGLGFGSGVMLTSPQTTSGNPAAKPTPIAPGVIQNVKLTIGAEIKTLFGQNQWAVDSAVGKRTIKGSFEFAQLSNDLMGQLLFGSSAAVTAGTVQTPSYPGELQTIPASSPYIKTVTNAADVPLIDYGVTYQQTAYSMTRVALCTVWAATTPFALGAQVIDPAGHVQTVTAAGTSGGSAPTWNDSGSTTTDGSVTWHDGGLPTVGTYAADSSGRYAFAAADTGLGVYINYSWTATGGTTLTASQAPMGNGPVLGLNLVFPYEQNQGNPIGLGFYLPNVRLGKIDLATKLDDYSMYTTDFEGFAGAAGVPFISYQAF